MQLGRRLTTQGVYDLCATSIVATPSTEIVTPAAVQAPETVHDTAEGPERSDSATAEGTGARCTFQPESL